MDLRNVGGVMEEEIDRIWKTVWKDLNFQQKHVSEEESTFYWFVVLISFLIL